MRPSSLLFAAALVLIPGAGCTWRPGGRPEAALPAAPVALVTEGTAFARPGVRERIVKAVTDVSGGRAALFVEPAGARSDPRRRLAVKLAKENPRLAGYDWREPQCAAEAGVLVALASNTDAVYRVVLDATAKTRPATPADLASPTARPRGLRKVLADLRREEPRAVREESVIGSVALSVFAPRPSPPRVPVDRRDARLEPGAPPTLLDPAAIGAAALRRLPPPRAPEWEGYARRLVAAGCPLLAMSVAEARLGTGRTFKSLQASALDTMRRNVDRRAAPAPAAETPKEASAGDGTLPTSTGPDRSCSALCGMHMVELCNNDTALWIAHRVRWETTPCGTRRPEAFLAECYRQQWQSGTFEDACVTPCEATPEGRERLEDILRRGGCLRD